MSGVTFGVRSVGETDQESIRNLDMDNVDDINHTVKCQTLTTFGIHIYIYFGGVWKGFGSEYIYLSYTIECSFIRVSRGFGRVWVTIYIYIAIPNVVRVWQFTVLYVSDKLRLTDHTTSVLLVLVLHSPTDTAPLRACQYCICTAGTIDPHRTGIITTTW